MAIETENGPNTVPYELVFTYFVIDEYVVQVWE